MTKVKEELHVHLFLSSHLRSKELVKLLESLPMHELNIWEMHTFHKEKIML